MARCRLGVGWCVRALVAFTILAGAGLAGIQVAEAANTSRPTGRGAIHDNSVYCQNSPGQPARPAYRGTGSQNPFGGECGPGPALQPPQAEPQQAEDSCPLRQASASPPGIVLVATSADVRPGLWLGDHKVLNARQAGLQDLTQRRKEIFEAMRCSRTRAFRFADQGRLRDTIELRAKVIERMEARLQGRSPVAFGCNLGVPSGWETYPEAKGTLMRGSERFAARSLPGVSAHAAVQAFRTAPSELDCHAGVQLTVLDAADELLGAAAFDDLHPQQAWPHFQPVRPDGRPATYALIGLGVALLTDEDLFTPSLPALRMGPVQITPPLQFGFWTTVVRNASLTSLAKHLFVVRYHLQGEPDPAGDLFAGKIEAADMVPGDWAYLKNVPDYESEVPYGAFAGENAFYIRERTRGDPTSRVFFGFGLEPRPGEPGRFFTEHELATHMAEDFNRNAPRRPQARPEQMVWTRLGSPMLDGADPREAGPFVR